MPFFAPAGVVPDCPIEKVCIGCRRSRYATTTAHWLETRSPKTPIIYIMSSRSLRLASDESAPISPGAWKGRPAARFVADPHAPDGDAPREMDIAWQTGMGTVSLLSSGMLVTAIRVINV